MSDYKYYEFQAVDRPLDGKARNALREISERARITSNSFTNFYTYGSFGGDPQEFMSRWFDLHLHYSDGVERRLMIRVPRRFLDHDRLRPFIDGLEEQVGVFEAGDNIVIDITREDEFPLLSDEEGDDSVLLAGIAPLREALIAGDLRLLYLVWLMGVESEAIGDDVLEPLPGIAPITPAMETFAGFFAMNIDLYAAAAEAGGDAGEASQEALRRHIDGLGEEAKSALLLRVAAGDVHVGAELRQAVAHVSPVAATRSRTVGELRRRARELCEADRAEMARLDEEAQRKRAAAEAAQIRARLDALAARGPMAWRDVEAEIERRNGPGYDRAVALLTDLKVVATEQGTLGDFDARLETLRQGHAKKGNFIARLAGFGHNGSLVPS